VADFRLVATDLDGTLLRLDGTVSDRTRQTLRRVRDAGLDVTLVSARAPLWLRPVAEDLDLDAGYAVCSNGAVVYDWAADQWSSRGAGDGGAASGGAATPGSRVAASGGTGPRARIAHTLGSISIATMQAALIAAAPRSVAVTPA
jgi:haloacid dehalogenase-like hydrolase